MGKRKLTKNQIEFNKQVKRVKNFIRRATKRGFTFDVDIPSMPKRVTQKALNAVKNLTPDVLYKKAQYVSVDTGELMTGTEGRAYERKQAAKHRREAKQTASVSVLDIPVVDTPVIMVDEVLDKVMSEIAQWQPLTSWNENYAVRKENDRDKLYDLMNSMVSTHGKETVAMRLEREATRVTDIINIILYCDSEEEAFIPRHYVELLEIMNGGSLTFDETVSATNASDYYDSV